MFVGKNWLSALVFMATLQTGCASLSPSSSEQKTATEENSNFSVGNEYAKDGLLREAAQTYRKVLHEFPEHHGAHRNLGIVLVKAGDYKKAIFHLEKSMARYDENFETNFYLGEAYRATEKFGEAIYRYKKALKIREKDVKTLKALAWSYYKIRFYSESLRTTSQLRKLAPQDTQVAIIAARTLLKIGQDKKALSLITRAQRFAAKADVPYLQSVEGDILLKMEDCKKALDTYRAALKEQPLLAGALLGLGQCLLKTGTDAETALTYIERAMRIKPRLTEGLYVLGQIYEKIDRTKSLRYYQQFRKQAAADPEFLSQIPEVKEKINFLSKKQ